LTARICLALVGMLAAAGCTDRAGTAFVEIENAQFPAGGRAEPILIDPRVEVVSNQFQRSYINHGSNIKQKIVIRGPVMIVPAPAGAAATQPTK
jgi:hypothetical protein